MIPFWVLYCLRARSPWFFTTSNPTLTFGGFDGETKMEMYRQLPPASYPKTHLITPSLLFKEVEEVILQNNFSFPLAVKPDVGRMGLMFRKISSCEELRAYHNLMSVNYVIQDYVTLPLEVSVFYWRMPGEKRGTITGFVKKEHLSVTGDGKSTLHDLMLNYPRLQFRLQEMKRKHAQKLHDVLQQGEPYILCQALNLSRGGKLVNIEKEKDDRLLTVFDDLSHYTGFYFGRYDIKCASLEDLKAGRNFSILEFNGSGAEPHHVYGNGNSLITAIRILLHHWNVLFMISAYNHERGVRHWSFRRGYEHMQKTKKHIELLRRLEADSAMRALYVSDVKKFGIEEMQPFAGEYDLANR